MTLDRIMGFKVLDKKKNIKYDKREDMNCPVCIIGEKVLGRQKN